MPVCSRCGVDQPEEAFSEESEPLCDTCYEIELEEEAAGGIIGNDTAANGEISEEDYGGVDQIVMRDEDDDDDDYDGDDTNGDADDHHEKNPHKPVPLAGAARIFDSEGELLGTPDESTSQALGPPDIDLLKPLIHAVESRGYSKGFGLDSLKVLAWRLKFVLFDDEQTSVITWLIHPLVEALLDNSEANLSVKVAPLNTSVVAPQSLLHWLCQWKLLQLQCGWKGHDDFVDLLLRAGAPVDAQLPNKCTPLFFAVKYASVDTCRLLMDAGADLLKKDCRKQTCLRNVLPQANPYILKLLLQKGLPADETFLAEAANGNKIRINALDILVTEFVAPVPDVSWATLGMASVDDYAMCILILLQTGLQISPHYLDVSYFLGHYLQGSIQNPKRSFYTQQIAALFMGNWLPSAAQEQLSLFQDKTSVDASKLTSEGSKGCGLCAAKTMASLSIDAGTIITLRCGHTFCPGCFQQYTSPLESSSSLRQDCPTCHSPLGHDLTQRASTPTTLTSTDNNSSVASTVETSAERRLGLAHLVQEQLQFECEARNLVVAQNDIKDHCIESIVHDWQDFTLPQGLGEGDAEGAESNGSSRLMAELTLSNTMISEDNYLWVAPSNGSVMIPITVKGIPIFALVSTTSPYTVLSPRFVQTFGFQLNSNLQASMSSPMKFIRAEDDDQKMGDGKTNENPMRNNPDELPPSRKPRIIMAPEVCLTAVQEFSLALGKSGITVRLPNALQANDPQTHHWPVGVILGLDFLQSAAWTQLSVEVDLEVCLGRTVGLLTKHSESLSTGLDFELLEPRRANQVEQDFRYYSKDGNIFWAPLWHITVTTSDYCLSLGQVMRELLPYPNKKRLACGGDADNCIDKVITKCNWCCREFPFVSPAKQRSWKDWALAKPMSSGMLECTLCSRDGKPAYYCDNQCWQQAKSIHSDQVHGGVVLPQSLNGEHKRYNAKIYALRLLISVIALVILSRMFVGDGPSLPADGIVDGSVESLVDVSDEL